MSFPGARGNASRYVKKTSFLVHANKAAILPTRMIWLLNYKWNKKDPNQWKFLTFYEEFFCYDAELKES